MEKSKKRYITGFDGIRSLAVIGVILYHLMPSTMKGGYLGVPIFFVVSGYLITDLLTQEWEKNKKINIWQFYLRRMKRLYPAMIGMFIFAISYITLFQQNLLQNIRQIFISSMLYVNNWWQISNGLSYFDRFASESPFTHIWSLAVEGQNYLLWPLIFIVLMLFVKQRPKIFYIVMGAGLVSAVLMGILYTPGADPTRVYYGTDTRLFSILIGSALAFVWPSTRLKQKISASARQTLNIIGLVSLVIVVAGLLFLGDQLTFVYWGGMYIYSIFCALLVAITAHPGASLNKWLSNPVFTWLGQRSYGIYLYQYPVMIFYEAKITNLNSFVWLHTLIEILLILAASELSYRLIETPLRKFDYTRAWARGKEFLSRPKSHREYLLYISTILMIGTSLFGFMIAPTAANVAEDQAELQAQITENSRLAEETKKQTEESTEGTETSETSSEPTPGVDSANYDLTENQLAAASNMNISAFGDSIVLDVANDFQSVFPTIVVDGEVGRQLYQSGDRLNELAAADQLKENVIVSLGTNGPFTEEQFDGIMAILGDRRVYWVNLHLPTRRWETEVNDMLAQMDEKYDNLSLIDWHTYSADHEDWFYSDRVHPNVEGAIQYTNLIAKTILADSE